MACGITVCMSGLKTKDAVRLEISKLSKADEFLVVYEQMCLEHGMIVDAGCGTAMVSTATKYEISKHIKELKSMLETSQSIYREMAERSWTKTSDTE